MSYYTSIKNTLVAMWNLTQKNPQLASRADNKLAVADQHLKDALRYLERQAEEGAQLQLKSDPLEW